MILQTLLCLTVLINNTSDTLMLPISEGKVKVNPVNLSIFYNKLEAIIFPTNSYEVKSCSDGKVANIRQTLDNRYAVVILYDSFSFTYILDTVNTKNGEYIKKAQVIGKLQNCTTNEMASQKPLLFIVTKNNQTVDANKFLVFKRNQRTRQQRK